MPQLSDLISAMYEAAVHPGEWTSFLEKFAEAVNGEGTVFLTRHVPSFKVCIHASARIDPSVVSLYETRYATDDVRALSVRRPAPAPVIRGPFEVCSKETLLRSSFYHEFMKPHDIFHDLVGVLPARDSFRAVCSMRSVRRPGFGDEDAALLHQLMPHFQRALEIRERISDIDRKAAASSDALDHWHIGWLAVDSECRIKQANRAARAILDRRQGLRINQGRLHAEVVQDTSNLRQAVKEAASGRRLLSSILIRREPILPLSVLISGIHDGHSRSLGSDAVAVFISDPSSGPARTFDDIVRQLYGLTAAEAKMAAQLARGKSVRIAAEELRVSFHTAREYAKRIYAKIGVRRQNDLAHLLLTSTAQVDPPFEE